MIHVHLDGEHLLGMLRSAPDRIAGNLESALDRIAQEYAREMRRNAPDAFGHLRNSIRVSDAGPMQRDVGSSMAYSRMVEEGTGPGGWPSMRSVADWAKRKSLSPMPGDTERDMVWKIRRAIARKGTRAQPFARPVAESPAMRARALKLMEDAVNRSFEVRP